MNRRTILATCLALVASTAAAPPARADESPVQREANTHFQRAVQLYGEADYRAALVEFKRAYELAPHVTVLYNIGQSYYQLQSYAEALGAFERFLAEGGTLHRQEVENAVAVLKTRVGRIDVTTPTPGWDIAIDDEMVGKTPLARPLAVSIGRRKVSVAKPGETPAVRVVEVAAGETLPLALGASAPAPSSETSPAAASRSEDRAVVGPTDGSPRRAPIIVAWSITGALAIGGAVTGILAAKSASDLSDERGRFPTTAARLDDDAAKTTRLSVTTDILLGAAILGAGVSLWLTLTRPSGTRATALRASGRDLGLGGSF